jgi:hypothetical protein
MILISAKPSNGFWRCGVFHPSEQTEHADEAFTPEQLEVLKAEPMLSVFITEGAPVVTDENPAGDENSPVGDNKKPKSKAE